MNNQDDPKANASQPTITPPPAADKVEPTPQANPVTPQPIQPEPVQSAQTASSTVEEPSKDTKQVGESGDPLRSDFQTPNYGESATEGEGLNKAGVPEEFLHLFEHDASEIMLEQATRHPIGVFAIFSFAGFAVFLIVIGFIFLASDSSFLESIGVDSAGVLSFTAIIAVVLVAFITGGALLAANVYKKSRLILTNQKVVLIQYHSIISREVSQLNIGEVEDVNVSQPTIFDRIFKTGRITIETAGEQNNYVLTQVEDPYSFARRTIQMHEGSIAEYGN